MAYIFFGTLDTPETKYYLGGGGFIILTYSLRTFIAIKNKSKSMSEFHLNLIDKIFGYVALVHGYLFASVIFIGIAARIYFAGLHNITLADLASLTIFAVLSMYGYVLVKYCRFTLNELR